VGDRRVAVLICFEDIEAERVRNAVEDGNPDLLVNLTSDAWFGSSRVPSLHMALSRLRAIEHRRFLVHATNTGITSVFDPNGRVFQQLPPGRVASAVVPVRWLRSRTVYEDVGKAPAYALTAVAVALCAWKRSRRRS
jgi:apolipoprotein N-acyltransferase